MKRKNIFPTTPKHVSLISHKLNPDESNLFDDIYTEDKKTWEDYKNEIKSLTTDTNKNFLKIGRMLLQGLNGKLVECSEFKIFLDYIGLKRTQSLKYIEAYNYCNRKFQNNQLTDSCYDLGIEKLYLLAKLENIQRQNRLEQFVIDNNISVKTLHKLVDVLNGKNEIINLAKKFDEECEKINEDKQN